VTFATYSTLIQRLKQILAQIAKLRSWNELARFDEFEVELNDMEAAVNAAIAKEVS